MPIEKRAITAEQKEERAGEILDIAKKKFLRTDFHGIKMADIAKAAGIAKGTLFFYFKTKEELFLALAKKEISGWNDEFDKALREQINSRKNTSVKEFIILVMKTLEKNDALVPLFAILDDTLENNIDVKTAYDFKSFMLKRIITSGQLIEQVLSFIKKGDGAILFFYAFSLITGTHKVTNPSPVIRKLAAKPGMEMFNLKFNDIFPEILGYFLLGYESSSREGS